MIAALGVATQGALLADGFHLAGQSPEAVAKGNAFVATADTSAAVYYNAAGLTQIEDSQVQLGFYSIDLDIEARTAGGTFKTQQDIQIAPQIYSAFRITDEFVMGVGLNSPFGLASEWSDTTTFPFTATESELKYATLWLVGGYEINEALSVGGGVGFHYADITLDRFVAIPTGGDPLIDEFRFEGDDQAVSWTLSLRWQPCEKHAFGAVYRSETDFTLKGKSQILGTVDLNPFSQNASVDLTTPATFAVGYSYRPNRCWNIEANIEWVDWDVLDVLVLDNSLTSDEPFPFDWEDAFIYSVGAEYDFGNGYLGRFGYNFIESAQTDTFYNPGVGDADRHWLTCGIGHKGETWSWDLAYQYAFSNHTVSGAFDPGVNGKYKSRFHSLSFAARYEF